MRRIVYRLLPILVVAAGVAAHEIDPTDPDLTFPGAPATFRVHNGPGETGCTTNVVVEVNGDAVSVSPSEITYTNPPTSEAVFTVTPLKAGNALIVATWRILSPSPSCSGSSILYLPVTVTAGTAPNLTIQKTAPATVGASAAFSYQISVGNTGNADATGVVLSDALPAGVRLNGAVTGAACTAAGNTIGCNLGTLAPGQSANLTIPVLAPDDTGSITNTATVAAANAATQVGSASTTVNLTSAPNLTLTKTAAATVSVGGALTYSIVVSNVGTVTANNVVVNDVLPASITLNGQPSGAECSGGPSIVCTIPSIAAGQSVTITIPAKAPTTEGTVVNSATATAGNVSGTATSSVSTTVTQPAVDLSIVKTAPDKAIAGGPLVYSIIVTNTSTVNATDVTVRDTLPQGVTLSGQAAGAACSGASTVVCTIPTLAAGQSVSITIPVVAPFSSGTISNTATVTAAHWTGGGTSTASTVVEPDPLAGAVIIKTGPSTVPGGSAFEYRILVANPGQTTLTELRMTDPLPPGVRSNGPVSGGACTVAGRVSCDIPVLLSGQSILFVIPVIAPLTPGQLSNTATLSLSSGAGKTSTFVLEVLPSVAASLAVSKQAPATALPGGQFQYGIEVTNTGEVDATNVSVSDVLPGGVDLASAPFVTGGTCSVTGRVVSCTIASIAPGATSTVYIPVVVTTLEGDVANTALVTAGNAGGVLEASAHTSVAPGHAALSVKQEAVVNGQPAARVGRQQEFGFRTTISNAGPDPAQNVQVVIRVPNQFAASSTVAFREREESEFISDPSWCRRSETADGTFFVCNLPWPVPVHRRVLIAVIGTIDERGDSYVSRADATAVNSPPAFDEAAVSVEKSVDLRIQTEVTLLADNVLQYTITVTNNGPDDATDVRVTHALDEQVTVLQAPSDCVPKDRTVVCELGTMAAGTNRVRTIRAKTGQLRAWRHSSTTGSAAEVLRRSAGSSDDVFVGDIPAADLTVQAVLTVWPDGGEATVYIANRGVDLAHGVRLAFSFTGLMLDSSVPLPKGCSGSPNVVCQLGDVAPGHPVELRFRFLPTLEAAQVQANVGADTPDPILSNNDSVAMLSSPFSETNGQPDKPVYRSATGRSTRSAVPGSDPVIQVANLSSETLDVAGFDPLPTSLGGVSVTMNGIAAPVFSLSPDTVTFQTPWELIGERRAEVVLTSGNKSQSLGTIDLLPASPEIFSMDGTGTGQGRVTLADSATIAAPRGLFENARPVHRGETIVIDCIGLGAVEDPPPTGTRTPDGAKLPVKTPVKLTIGGVDARVTFAGLAPGTVGRYRVEAEVPIGAPSGGAIEVKLEAQDQPSNIVTIAVE